MSSGIHITDTSPRIAIVCDWISDWWWAELVLSHLIEMFPNADIFTSVFWQHENPLFENYEIVSYWTTPKRHDAPHIYTSSLQKIPFLRKKHKLALTLRSVMFESFDLSEYDIVISSTSAESKWVITKPDTLQICYCHTPTRYFWSHYEEYKKMMEFGLLNPIAKYIFPKMIKKLRRCDYIAAQRPDYFIANSHNTQNRIKKYYNRESEVIYPAIDISEFPHPWSCSDTSWNQDYYLCVGRCIPYKKFDLLVETFNTNGKPLILITNTDTKLYRSLKKQSRDNITWIFAPTREEIIQYYLWATACIFPPEEDFWLVPLEAQACGTPVIAYGKWWALETVWKWKTGLFFDEQTPESLQKAIDTFESMTFDTTAIRKHAEQFDVRIFQKKIKEYIEKNIWSSM